MTRSPVRRGDTEIVVFGRHAIQEALRSEGVELVALAIERGRPAEDRRWLRREAHERGLVLEELSREELTGWTDAPRHDQGLAARLRLLRVIELEAFVARLSGPRAREPVRLVGLDGVTNSQNVGMVVRSLVAAGLDGLLWPLRGQPWVNGLVVRAASGAVFECPILRCETIGSGIAALQAAGFTCFGLDSRPDRPSLFETPVPHRAAFFLGSESRGLSEDVTSQLDEHVRIPMPGRLESLNVAVAAGLVAYHAAGLLTGEGRRE